jgi:hypothetical protein
MFCKSLECIQTTADGAKDTVCIPLLLRYYTVGNALQ